MTAGAESVSNEQPRPDLGGGQLAMARAGYAVVALLVVITLGAGVPRWIVGWLAGAELPTGIARATVPAAGVVSGAIVLFALTATFAFVGTAALIYWRQPRRWFALFVSLTLLLRSAGFMGDLPDLVAVDPTWAGPVATVRSLDGVCALLFLLVFPDGRFVPRATAILWLAWAAWALGTLATPALSPILTAESWAPPLLVALACSGLLAQVYRYRQVSTPRQRLQTKWITLGIALYVGTFALRNIGPIVAPEVGVHGSTDQFWFVVLTSLADDASATIVPISIAIAILRTGLLGIDLILNRTIVYFAVTAILAGAFGAVSTGAQLLLVEVSGHRSDLVTLVIALAVGATFGPVKAYVQLTVDRALGTYRRDRVAR